MNPLKFKPKICKRDYVTLSATDYVLVAPDLDYPLAFTSKVDLICESLKHKDSQLFKVCTYNLEK